MKRVFPLILSLFLLFSLVPATNAAPAPTPNGRALVRVFDHTRGKYQSPEPLSIVNLELNGDPLEGDISGLLLQNRTLAPLRLLAEGLGAEVEWLSGTNQVLVGKGEDQVLLTLGSADAEVNGQPRQLPDGVPATLVNSQGVDYTMVPLRFFSETLGYQVDWDQHSYTAQVKDRDYILNHEPVIPDPHDPLLEGLDTPIAPAKYLICLDAGHGGPWSGACYEQIMEKDLNISMIHKLDNILRTLGYRTLLTRHEDEDVGLKERSIIANDANADIFVSIHCNAIANAPNCQGLYVFHYPRSAEGKALALAIQTPACQFSGAVDRGISSANFSVVRESHMPSVLIEVGFMSCHQELMHLADDDYQTQLARGIAQGIIHYLNAQG